LCTRLWLRRLSQKYATDLHELYNSKQNSTMESGTKFAVPTIFSKMVYVGTDHHVSVFGLK